VTHPDQEIEMSKQTERRRRVVRATAPAAGLLAAGLLVWQGSYAAFSATTVDSGNAWSSGNLTLTNNGGSGAVYAASTSATFGGSNLKPGSTGSNCLSVKSTGSIAGSLKMYMDTLADSSPSLASQISLTVTQAPAGATDVLADCSNFPAAGVTSVQTATLAAFQNSYATAAGAQAVAAGTVRQAYKVAWTFTSTGTNPGDNALQGKTATASFTWEIQ
jgi:hypothetical protein